MKDFKIIEAKFLPELNTLIQNNMKQGWIPSPPHVVHVVEYQEFYSIGMYLLDDEELPDGMEEFKIEKSLYDIKHMGDVSEIYGGQKN